MTNKRALELLKYEIMRNEQLEKLKSGGWGEVAEALRMAVKELEQQT